MGIPIHTPVWRAVILHMGCTGVCASTYRQSHSCLLGHSGCTDTASAPYLTGMQVPVAERNVHSGTHTHMSARLKPAAVSMQPLLPYRHKCECMYIPALCVYVQIGTPAWMRPKCIIHGGFWLSVTGIMLPWHNVSAIVFLEQKTTLQMWHFLFFVPIITFC